MNEDHHKIKNKNMNNIVYNTIIPINNKNHHINMNNNNIHNIRNNNK